MSHNPLGLHARLQGQLYLTICLVLLTFLVLKPESAGKSKTLPAYQTTRHHILEDGDWNISECFQVCSIT
jgi:hypothetical protein